MFLSITATRQDGDATELGYLMAKHPSRVQDFALSFGTAWVYYPEVTAQRCTIALQVEVDPVGLVRNKRFRAGGFALSAYINDRPYAPSSMLAVAIKKVYGTALKGTCQDRPDLLDVAWDLEVGLGAPINQTALAELFEPLGWRVEDQRLLGRHRVSEALTHLYVLLPVLDGSKHYWVADDEVTKLVTHADTWLPSHPLREQITNRYLAGQRPLVHQAQLLLDEEPPPPPSERVSPLAEVRRETIAGLLGEIGVSRVIDVGCGEGRLIARLLKDSRFEHILGLDVSATELAKAEQFLHLDTMPRQQRSRVSLAQSSLTYLDDRLAGAQAVVLSEVIEHLDPPRLADLERTVFALAPRHVLITTPNAEYNTVYALAGMRHPDHRFEWTRDEFEQWCRRIATAFGYQLQLHPVGQIHPTHGAPTQLAWFEAA